MIDYQCSNVPSTAKTRNTRKIKETVYGLASCAIVGVLVAAVLWGLA